jgi:hypothetical protein
MSGGMKDRRRQKHDRASRRRLSRVGASRRVVGTYIIGIALVMALVATPATPLAQSKKKAPAKSEKKTPTKSEPTLADRVATAKAEVVVAAKTYKVSLEKLLEFQQNDVKALTEQLEKRKALLAESIISKKEVDESEQAVITAQAKVAVTQKEITEADNLIAEATGEAQLAKLGPSRLGTYQTTAALIRYNGPAHWVLSDSAKVGSFFASKFRRAMPISAYGQTSVHDHLGFDHRNSMDVAVNPDSAEGQALMGYLRSLGIPFIAFRYAVKGSATGAHIHVGYPSHRISK